MSYLRQDIINKLYESTNNFQEIKNVYQEPFVNYRGKTTDSKEFFTEVVAEEIMRNNIFNLMSRIEERKRTEYKVVSHDGISDTVESYRNEEIFCKKLFRLSKNEKKSFDEIGEILDYQVPLKYSRSDIGVGKIDLISKKENDIWLLEVKVQNNDETVLRCVLEISTYYQLLNKSSFIKSYSELSGRSILDIRKGILVAKCSSQEKELDKMKKGDSKHLNKLMEILQVAAFTIDGDNNVARVFLPLY